MIRQQAARKKWWDAPVHPPAMHPIVYMVNKYFMCVLFIVFLFVFSGYIFYILFYILFVECFLVFLSYLYLISTRFSFFPIYFTSFSRLCRFVFLCLHYYLYFHRTNILHRVALAKLLGI